MKTTNHLKEISIKAQTTTFGNFIDFERSLIDLPNMTFVSLLVPEYERNGLGRMIAKTVRYWFTDIEAHGCTAMSIGADSSRAHVIYEDMQPIVLGSFTEVQAKAAGVSKLLFSKSYAPEMVVLGVETSLALGLDAASEEEREAILAHLALYHRRATWMESHGMEVLMSNMEALVGDGRPFDWPRIFPEAEGA